MGEQRMTIGEQRMSNGGAAHDAWGSARYLGEQCMSNGPGVT